MRVVVLFAVLAVALAANTGDVPGSGDWTVENPTNIDTEVTVEGDVAVSSSLTISTTITFTKDNAVFETEAGADITLTADAILQGDGWRFQPFGTGCTFTSNGAEIIFGEYDDEVNGFYCDNVNIDDTTFRFGSADSALDEDDPFSGRTYPGLIISAGVFSTNAPGVSVTNSRFLTYNVAGGKCADTQLDDSVGCEAAKAQNSRVESIFGGLSIQNRETIDLTGTMVFGDEVDLAGFESVVADNIIVNDMIIGDWEGGKFNADNMYFWGDLQLSSTSDHGEFNVSNSEWDEISCFDGLLVTDEAKRTVNGTFFQCEFPDSSREDFTSSDLECVECKFTTYDCLGIADFLSAWIKWVLIGIGVCICIICAFILLCGVGTAAVVKSNTAAPAYGNPYAGAPGGAYGGQNNGYAGAQNNGYDKMSGGGSDRGSRGSKRGSRGNRPPSNRGSRGSKRGSRGSKRASTGSNRSKGSNRA